MFLGYNSTQAISRWVTYLSVEMGLGNPLVCHFNCGIYIHVHVIYSSYEFMVL
jgi:hypothetical protein